jgi:methylmalonyl-CoA mutase C-terminal domain/subunit
VSRVLIAKPGLDGHDRGAKVITRVLRDAGMEVVYTGLHQSIEAIARAAADEDVELVGLSILSGAHLAYTAELRSALDAGGLGDVPIVVGGIVPEGDAEALRAAGAADVFPPNTNLLEIPGRIARILAGSEEDADG